jgi:SAM-dependent methyltransferase
MFSLFGSRVLGGPFKGMAVPECPQWDDGNASCKLLGSYEFELNDVIERAIARRPKQFINVGCAEGYYAIGMALRMPALKVYAIDTDEHSLAMCRDYAARNGVADRITTGKEALDWGPAFYLIDCEGAEWNLPKPDDYPSLRHSDLIIECHDFLDKRISATLADRFRATHDVEWIKPRLPDFARYDMLRDAPCIITVLALTEKRPSPCLWLALWAKERGDCNG